jgi:uncharacterized membrane protein
VIFDIVALAGSDDLVFAKASTWLIGIGILGALLAALFGLMDLSVIPRGTKAFTYGLTHMALNLVTVALFVISFFIRHAHGYDDVPAVAFILSVIALAILGVSGWLGGELSYHYGVRVADEQKQTDGFDGYGASRAPSEK